MLNPMKTDTAYQYQKRLLMVDALGAFSTAVTIGGIFAPQIVQTGLPDYVLYAMAAVAGCFFLIGAISLFVLSNLGPPLCWLAILNLLYCLASLSICALFSNSLTSLGIIYFSVEVLIVCILAWFEWKASGRALASQKV
jgi:hypothetical protein